MKPLLYPDKSTWKKLTERTVLNKDKLKELVVSVFAQVKEEGDKALKEFTQTFDGVALTTLLVDDKEIQNAHENLDKELCEAIQTAKKNIETFHLSQKPLVEKIETEQGITCWRENRAIEKVGIYIPGGTAPLFSTVLMLAIPAQIAGCGEIVLCTPPDKNGNIAPAILYAAQICGVTQIVKVGGTQAIAGMTLGTESIPQVYKIFGPGNQYVTAAKEYATELGVAIDMPAGPSEVLVIADKYAVPEFCAADLLSQAEHGADSQVVFLTTDKTILDKTLKALKKQLETLPRKELAEKSIQNSRFILLKTLEECFDFSNLYAPEHLILALRDAEKYTSQIKNAGSVFLGNYSCESIGDYASGTNHTLPTNRYARNYSGVSLDSFVKKVTFQEVTKEGLQQIGNTVEIMAEKEGLFAHKNAVSIRLNYLEKKR